MSETDLLGVSLATLKSSALRCSKIKLKKYVATLQSKNENKFEIFSLDNILINKVANPPKNLE